MWRMIATSDFEVQLSVVFDVWTKYKLQANTKSVAYSRVDAITYLLMQAFHGVNMAGVGTFYFNRSKHGDCGSSIFDDGKSNVGRRLVLGLSVQAKLRMVRWRTIHGLWAATFLLSNRMSQLKAQKTHACLSQRALKRMRC